MAPTHSKVVYDVFISLQRILRNQEIKVDGESLDLASIIAVSTYGPLKVALFGPISTR